MGTRNGENDKNLEQNNIKRGFIKEVLKYVIQYNSSSSAFSKGLP